MQTGGLVVPREQSESGEALFARLSDRQIDSCYSLAGYLLGDATEAQDATQEAMARAWRARGSLRDSDAFEGWLDRIVVNACMDRMGKRKLIRVVEIEAGGGGGAGGPLGA